MGKHPAQPGVTVTVTQIGEAGDAAQKRSFDLPAKDGGLAARMFVEFCHEVEYQISRLFPGRSD
jgi:hypothetical protein